MITSLILAAALAGQAPARPPAAKLPPKPEARAAARIVAGAAVVAAETGLRGASRRVAGRREDAMAAVARRIVTPGETILVGPAPGGATVIATAPGSTGVDLMLDIASGGPGNLIRAQTYMKSKTNLVRVFVPFRSRVINVTAVEHPVEDAVWHHPQAQPPRGAQWSGMGEYWFPPAGSVMIPVALVLPLEGPLQGQPVHVIVDQLYATGKVAGGQKIDDMTYADRVRLWESILAGPSVRSKSRAKGRVRRAPN